VLKNFLLVSYRNLKRNRGSSLLNILSLSLGMAVCLFIFQYLYFEYSYDSFHSNADKLYRVQTDTYNLNDRIKQNAYSQPNIGKILKEEFEEIIDYTRLIPFSDNGTAFFQEPLENGTFSPVYIEKAYFAENSLFNLFSIDLIEGDISKPLGEPNSILISESKMQTLFGADLRNGQSVVGKSLKTGREGLDENIYTIKGVFKDLPTNSHLKFDLLVSLSSPESGLSLTSVSNQNSLTYVLSNGSTDLKTNEIEASNLVYPSKEAQLINFRLSFVPIKKIHYSSKVSNEPEPTANILFLTFLGIIGLIILILASTNYINSAIINSIDRTKEVGVRKLLGIKPHQLILTFLGEALFINVIAGVLALFNFILGLRLISLYSQIQYPVPMDITSVQSAIGFIAVLVIASALCSGIYPAWFLSELKPLDSLRGNSQVTNSKLSSKGSKVIRFLLIFQLTLGIIFLSSVYIVYQQLEYLKVHDNQPIGLKVTAKFPGLSGTTGVYLNQYQRFIQNQLGNERITEVRLSNLYYGQIRKTQIVKPFYLVGNERDTTSAPFRLYIIDYQYWRDSSDVFLSGANFSSQFGKDYDHVIVNESAMAAIGFDHPDKILNKRIGQYNGYLTVSGVVKNQTALEPPKVYLTGAGHPTYFEMTVQIPGSTSDRIKRTLDNIEILWSAQFPNFYFLERQFDDQLKSEKNILVMFFSFSFIAIFIACLGMFGLSSFTTYKRTKEIGIRKVLGANSFQILILLMSDFLSLIFYACVFAIPIIIYGSTEWLNNYALRINLSPLLLLIPITVIMCICFLIVIRQCWRTATSNPVLALASN
jgi:putative ABC transport system permease protein